LKYKALLNIKNMNQLTFKLKTWIRIWLSFFMLCLILSGLTAIPVKQEIDWLISSGIISSATITEWLLTVQADLHQTPLHVYYGFDWLAFAHLVIAVAFIGPLKDPVRNIWVIEFGIIACIMVLPFAALMGTIRAIPYWWVIIDCSFGVAGLVPLLIVKSKIKALEKLISNERLNTIF
jgi:hypothetical protein